MSANLHAFFQKSFPDFPISEKMFPRFPGFQKKISPIFRFSEKHFPDFPIFGEKFPRFSSFRKKFPRFPILENRKKSEKIEKIRKTWLRFQISIRIFISRKMDI